MQAVVVDDMSIAQKHSQVDAEEEPDVQELQLPRVCKWQEEELGDGDATGHLFHLVLGGFPKGKRERQFRGEFSERNLMHFSQNTPETAPSLVSERLLAGVFHELWLVQAEGVTGRRGLC